MRTYRIRDVYSDDHSATDDFAKTRRLARDKMLKTESEFRGGVQIDLLQLPTDSDNVTAILARKDFDYIVLRSWRGTRRGGLREVDAAPGGTRITRETAPTTVGSAPRRNRQDRQTPAHSS